MRQCVAMQPNKIIARKPPGQTVSLPHLAMRRCNSSSGGFLRQGDSDVTQGIYKIENQQDGKGSAYIGNSMNIEKRWHSHRSMLRGGKHKNAHLQAAWNKYGEDAFAFSVLEEVSIDMLLPTEQKHLDDYFNRGRCYNINTTAGPAGPLPEETKRKISEATKGKLNHNWGKRPTEETRRRLSAAARGNQYGRGNQYALGYKHTEEAKRKMSAARKGKQYSNPGFLGRKHTKEARRKISKARIGRKHSEETRRKLSESHMGHVVSDETRRKLRRAAKQWWAKKRAQETGNEPCSPSATARNLP